MANSVELVTALAEIFGKSPMSVTNQMRYLREAGMITKTGRGTSAARMNREDAVTLLAAVMGSDQINDSEKVSKELLALPASSPPVCQGDAPLQALPDVHTFGDGLLKLFAWIDEPGKIALPHAAEFIRRQRATPQMEVRVYYPKLAARIVLRIAELGSESWGYARGRPSRFDVDGTPPRSREVDLLQMRSCSERTIEKLSRVLASQ